MGPLSWAMRWSSVSPRALWATHKGSSQASIHDDRQTPHAKANVVLKLKGPDPFSYLSCDMWFSYIFFLKFSCKVHFHRRSLALPPAVY
ncbi:Uncharacterized protein TCM_004231 [Theobroma cacao]|uniref:Uncharacterized protein n=1 Tax=Theobroma cacao TaxID=3641 RepID=A0A061DX69_THECC|nr:Uncharacterized protein TCM_004231 [Theobroma cacao]